LRATALSQRARTIAAYIAACVEATAAIQPLGRAQRTLN
jgi:hypothetical protein